MKEEVESIFASSQQEPSTGGLVRVHDVLPSMYWDIIPYDTFNRIQSVVCDTLLNSNENVVVSAPTVVDGYGDNLGLWQDRVAGACGVEAASRVDDRRFARAERVVSVQHRLCVSDEGAVQRDPHQVEQHVLFSRTEVHRSRLLLAPL